MINQIPNDRIKPLFVLEALEVRRSPGYPIIRLNYALSKHRENFLSVDCLTSPRTAKDLTGATKTFADDEIKAVGIDFARK